MWREALPGERGAGPRREALLTLETKNKAELKDLLVFARAESKARGSYERQVKRINTVVTASQKTRYDTAVAEKKKVWDIFIRFIQ